jgi:hypothetical protein
VIYLKYKKFEGNRTIFEDDIKTLQARKIDYKDNEGFVSVSSKSKQQAASSRDNDRPRSYRKPESSRDRSSDYDQKSNKDRRPRNDKPRKSRP